MIEQLDFLAVVYWKDKLKLHNSENYSLNYYYELLTYVFNTKSFLFTSNIMQMKKYFENDYKSQKIKLIWCL